ncbi:MAG: ABC transporter permease [Gemmatimonadota bacterium]|nr:ABC transporter permease [Gemmatimonadota bacterium]
MIGWLVDAQYDVLHAARVFRRSPGFALTVVLTIAVGIGAEVTIAGAVDCMVLQAPPQLRDPDDLLRLVFVSRDLAGNEVLGSRTSLPAFHDLALHVPALSDLAAYSSLTLSLGVGPEATEVRTTLVSPSFFHLLAMRPELGRLPGPSDGFPAGEGNGGPALAVLSYDFWRRQFGGDSSAIGQSIRIGTLLYTVIGVTASGFQGLRTEVTDVWLPISVTAPLEAPPLWYAGRGSAWLSLVGRRKRGSPLDVAAEQATSVWRELNTPPGASRSQSRVLAASVILGQGPDAPREIRVALWLAGISTLLLLIVCANVANLFIARSLSRRRELAVRFALGASRGRLARQMLTEATVLAGIGGIAAIALASGGSRVLQRLMTTDITSDGFLSARLFAYTGMLVVATALLVSLAPLLYTATRAFVDGIRLGPGSGGGRHSHARAVLLATQAGVCVVLLVVAGLFTLSLRRVDALDLGIDVDHTLVARFDLDRLAIPVPALDAAYDAMRERVRAIPGVVRVAFADQDPYRNGRAVSAHARSREQHYPVEVPMEAAVDSGFFRTVGADLRGRDFTASDKKGSPRVAIINEAWMRSNGALRLGSAASNRKQSVAP